MKPIVHNLRNVQIGRLLITVLLIAVGLLYFSNAYGAELPQRSLLLSDNLAGDAAIYQLGFTIPASETLGSIKLEFCDNNPLVGQPCSAPSGFNVSVAKLTAQSGQTGFSISVANTTNNTLVLTRTAAPAAAGPVSYTMTGVVNPSAGGTYYGRLQTFASVDASGPENDHGGLAFSLNSPVQLNATVPPYLLFCSGIVIQAFDCSTASGDYINLGNLSTATTSSSQTQMVTATNAANGYALQIYGTSMTSGNNVINALSVPDVSRPGISQFGLNLVANSTPVVGSDPQGAGSAAPTNGYNMPNFYKFVPGDTIASVAAPDDYRKLTASYLVNISKSQAPGVYTATLTYVCLANF